MQAQATATKARLQQMISEAKQDLIAYNTALTVTSMLLRLWASLGSTVLGHPSMHAPGLLLPFMSLAR